MTYSSMGRQWAFLDVKLFSVLQMAARQQTAGTVTAAAGVLRTMAAMSNEQRARDKERTAPKDSSLQGGARQLVADGGDAPSDGRSGSSSARRDRRGAGSG